MSMVRKGFTLIELIVVIVIIGILAAVAAVAYNSFIGNANKAAAEAEASDQAKIIQANSALANGVAAPNYGGISVVKGQCTVTVTANGTAPGSPFTLHYSAGC